MGKALSGEISCKRSCCSYLELKFVLLVLDLGLVVSTVLCNPVFHFQLYYLELPIDSKNQVQSYQLQKMSLGVSNMHDKTLSLMKLDSVLCLGAIQGFQRFTISVLRNTETS